MLQSYLICVKFYTRIFFIMSNINQKFDNFQKLLNVLRRMETQYKTAPNSETFKIALAHMYEVTFDLSWKLIKEYLENQGIIVKSPRDTIREASSIDIIDNDEIWLNMLESRNITSHQYNDEEFNAIVADIATFYTNALYKLEEFFNGKLK